MCGFILYRTWFKAGCNNGTFERFHQNMEFITDFTALRCYPNSLFRVCLHFFSCGPSYFNLLKQVRPLPALRHSFNLLVEMRDKCVNRCFYGSNHHLWFTFHESNPGSMMFF